MMRQVSSGSGQVLTLTPYGMAAAPSEQGESLAVAAATRAEMTKAALNIFVDWSV